MRQRVVDWIDERLQIRSLWGEVANHAVPPHVNFLHCFGGITFLLILLQIITGIFLTMYYVPSPDNAYASVEYITKEVLFGHLIRNMHRVGASGVVVMVFLHMLRVFYHGAYKKPRELNWVTGVFLFLTVIGFGFTGYLLPWDQKAYWATVVGANISGVVPVVGPLMRKLLIGGSEMGALTLSRFFAIHIWFLPAVLVVLLAFHFIMVRRQGISGPL